MPDSKQPDQEERFCKNSCLRCLYDSCCFGKHNQCGCSNRTVIKIEALTLLASFILQIFAVSRDMNGNDYPAFAAGVTGLCCAFCIVGLLEYSKKWMLSAAIMAITLFVAALITVIFLFKDGEAGNEPVWSIVMQFISLWLGALTCHACLSYRSELSKMEKAASVKEMSANEAMGTAGKMPSKSKSFTVIEGQPVQHV